MILYQVKLSTGNKCIRLICVIITLNYLCEIYYISLSFDVQSRSSILASICDCYTCCYDCQPSNDICNILLHKAGNGSGLLS